MKSLLIIRILLLPFGFFFKIWSLSKEGSRDIHNQIRFKGAKIDAGCCINANSEIAPKTHLLQNCIINNSQIASYSYIGKNCIVQNTTMGNYCSIADDVLIGLGKHPTYLISSSPLFFRKKNTLGMQLVDKDVDFKEYANITIGHDVWIGARAIILDGINVGHGAIIAANAVVTKDVSPYAIVAGVPAKMIKYRFTEDKIEQLLKSAWWNWSYEEIKLRIKDLNTT